MFMLINKITSLFDRLYKLPTSLNNVFLKQSNNNIGLFRWKLFYDKISKYKFILYIYIFTTMALCPWLDNLFNVWYDSEVYNLYIMILSFFIFNFFLNFFISIPSKNTLNFKAFFFKMKSSLLFINCIFVKLNKIILFFKNEIFFKSVSFNFIRLNLKKLSNYFVYWRPLFKRFSYFGFYKLSKSKFFKFNKN